MKRIKQFFRHHRLSREWRVVRHPAAILTMDVVRLKAVEYLADKRAIKDRFIQFGPIRNETDGRTVVIPASSAGKMLGASGVDIRRLAAAFDILFKKSLHVWTEPETDEPGHKRHPDVLWYHQYVCRFVCDMGEYFVRFAVKECRGQGGNAVHSSTITAVSMYKAQGARATDPGKDQGEANAPFVDNKLSLFFSAVNGVGPFVRKWWDFIDGIERIMRSIKRGTRA